MIDTIFTDYGIVKYKTSDDDIYSQVRLDEYLELIDKKVKDNSSNDVLVYDKESKELYTYISGEKDILKLNADLKREFENNENTKFNKKMRELLGFSEMKREFLAIDKKGTFDSFEEADFYARFLEKYENTDSIMNAKLLGAREYIINKADKNSDLYKYHFLKEKECTKSRIEYKINYNNNEIKDNKSYKREHVDSKIRYIIFFIVFLFIDLLIIPTIKIDLFAFMIFLTSVFLDKTLLDAIRDENEGIQKFDRRINEYKSENVELKKELEKVLNDINMFNKGVNKEVSVSSKEEVIEDNFLSETSKDLIYLINRSALLDENDKESAMSEIADIYGECKKSYNNDSEVVFSAEEFLISKLKTIKRIRKLSEEIENKINIKKKNKEFDDYFSEVSKKISSEESLSLKKH